MRAFGDAKTTRKLIYDNTLKAAQELEPVTNPRHTLRLMDVAYHGPEDFSIEEQKRALLSRGTLARKLQGTWVLSDTTTGQELARKRSTIATVPHLLDRGTFLINGNDYGTAHQQRLLPGAYARRQANGELESHVNVAKGLGHRIYLNPEKGVFNLHVGQANIPLMPLMRAMGATDAELRAAWGNKLTAANMQANDPQAINKLYARMTYNGTAADEQSKKQAILDAFHKMELDPFVSKHTLGGEYKNVDKAALIAITKKLLAVHQNEADPDDRDALPFQRFVGPEDIFPERLTKARSVARQLLWKAAARGNLDHVHAGAYTDAIHAALTTSGLGTPLEEINPAEVFDHQSRVTRMGEGGIPSLDAVPDESRAVHPTQFGYVDFLRTPESGKVGVDARLAYAARKGTDGRLYTPVRNLKTGEVEYKSPQDLMDEVVAFPGEMNRNEGMVYTLHRGKQGVSSRYDATYEVPTMEHTFSPLGTMVPMKSSVKGQRAVMAARMITQALPLVNAEAPLVQSAMPDHDDRSFEEEFGTHMGAIRANGGGTVESVSPNEIIIKGADGKRQTVQLYHNFPFNRKTFIHNTPIVKPGDQVQPNQLLAHSNYTNKDGTTALGMNARTIAIPWGGLNFEDAVVISRSYANKMKSEHMYQHGVEWEPTMKKGKNAFVSIFPSVYNREQLANFDDGGIIKPGTEVKHGDPLILLAQQREITHKMIHRGRGPSWSDRTVKWEHHHPGIVTDVVPTDKGVSVVVKAHAPMEVGDKLSGRFGDKGIVSRIVPDEQLPTDKNGVPYEVLTNPLGVISRTNPAQIVEAALGKIAAKTGKVYKVKDFQDHDLIEWAIGELQKHGIDDTESVIDPNTGRRIDDVFTGNRWFMKLHHTSESKNQGRGLGSYTADETPAKGGPEGAKRVGMLELNAILSHGATHVASDANIVRGQANPEHWAAVMGGNTPPTPQIPSVYTGFVNKLKASGINVVREGPRTHIMAMTDRGVDELSGDREIRNAETVDWKAGMAPKAGGLFDPALTGGHGGKRWSHIKLHEPLPNPVMEEPIRRVLGLTTPQFEKVLSGEEKLNGKTGPGAIASALDKLDLRKEIARAQAEFQSNKRGARDAAQRRMGYLKDAERLEMHPRDWMLSKVPVLPPAWRPVSQLGAKKLPLVADPNYLYAEMLDANSTWREASEQLGDDVGPERLAAYNAFKGVTGLGDPIHPKNRERQVKGILRHVFGSSPKLGLVQRQLLGSSVDLVGRAVIAPDPDLDMDQVGIPEPRAWDIYSPFIVRRLVRRGVPRLQAARAVKERSAAAREALLNEMENRPVIINRAPTLHKYGMMAAHPRLIKGDVMTVSPLVVGGFGADFDGDAMQFHVPSTHEAAQEALQKMLPSRNLFSAAQFNRVQYKPSQEYVGGLYEASARVENQPPAVFATVNDALKAYRQGRIGVGRKVRIVGS